MRVISDQQVNSVIDSLTQTDLKKFQDSLQASLESYSADPTLIPERIVVNRPDLEAVHLFMPSFAERVGIKSLGGSKEGFKGAVSILNETNGELQGVLNAFTLTAFRTALASSLALRQFVSDGEDQELTAYGNGLQVYWHVKITLLLYPRKFKNVQLSVRSINEKAKKLAKRLADEFTDVEFTIVCHTDTKLSNSIVVYGCIPSTEPNIKLADLSTKHRTFISLIGSYKPHMLECDDDIVQHALQHGKIIVDSYEHTLHEAGELIKNGVQPESCLELGELNESSQITTSDRLVLCKIVGLSIMDVSVGTDILKKAIAIGLGSEVDF